MAFPFRSTARGKQAPGHLEDDERDQGILYGGPAPTEHQGLRVVWQPLECDEEAEQKLLGTSRVQAEGVGECDCGSTRHPVPNAATHVQSRGSRETEKTPAK